MAKKNQDSTNSEDTRIALLEQSIGYIHEALRDIKDEIKLQGNSLNSKIDNLDKKFDSKIDKINDKIDSHFRTTIFMILGLYGGVIATLVTAVGRAYHWF